MQRAFRVRITVASMLITLFVANAFALEASSPFAASPAPISIVQSAQPVSPQIDTSLIVDDPPGISVKSAVGTRDEATVTVSALPRVSAASRSRRLFVEDQNLSEIVDIDVEKGEIRAFGVTFRPQADSAGTAPHGLMLSTENASVVLSGETEADGLTPRQRVSISRMNKLLSSTNVRDRAQRVLDILKRTQAERTAHGGIRALDTFACLWDIITIIVDWLSVVLACGPAIIIPAICILTILWATADTLEVCRLMPTDC